MMTDAKVSMENARWIFSSEKGRRDFCIECRKETEYLLQKKDIVKIIRDKEYVFGITVATLNSTSALRLRVAISLPMT